MEPTGKKQETGKTKSSEAQDLRDLFEVGLKDIYNAEKVLSKTLPNMVKNASSPELVKALQNHLNETEQQVSRLEQVFKATGIKPVSKKCEAMEGLLKENDGRMEDSKKGSVRDAGIIAAGQKVKHYEIASYGTLHAYAKTLGEDKAANLLAMTLDENKKSDADLTEIARSGINPNAATARINW
jgi:ferritin-like metal-binding protein YciE